VIGLAGLWHSRGKRGAAHDLLAPFHHWFTEGFDSPDTSRTPKRCSTR
jgi:hypothetical protein